MDIGIEGAGKGGSEEGYFWIANFYEIGNLILKSSKTYFFIVVDGVITDILLISLANLIFSPLKSIFEYGYIAKVRKRRLIKKYKDSRLFNQSDAN